MSRIAVRMTILSILSLSMLSRAQDKSVTEISGFVDLYYAYSWNRPPGHDRAFTTQPLRHNETNVNLAFLSVRREDESVRGRFALQTGTYVESNTAAEPPLLKHILEASVGTRLGKGVWVDAGIFPSHIGLEGIVSKDNWTYSRSLLADYSPYYESGVSITGAFSDNLTLRGLILNGWQNINETNSSKAVGTQLQYHSSEAVLLNWSTFCGNEAPDSSARQLRIFNDLGAQINLSRVLGIAAVFDIGVQEKASGTGYDVWHAASLIARYVVDSHWTAAGRVEYYMDRNGVIAPTGTPGNFQVVSGSVNIDVAPASSVLWRAEVRQYFSKDPLYPGTSGPLKSETCFVISVAATL